MKPLLIFIIAVSITCATATSDESFSSRSTEEDDSFSSSIEDVSSSRSSSAESTECTLNYQYTIWIGDNVDEMHSINLNSECGIVFLDAMQQASEKREQFKFDYTKHAQFGAFITQIDGVSNDDETNTYWMLYDLTTEPDVANAPDDRFLAPLGVSSLKVLDNHSYLFWYKNINTASDPSDVNQSEDSNEDSDFYN